MIVVLAKFTGKPEHRIEMLVRAHEFVPATHAEQGCLSCEFYEQEPGRNEFLFLEEWTDRAALEAHLQTPHFSELMAYKTDYMEGPHRIRIYAAEEWEDASLQMLVRVREPADRAPRPEDATVSAAAETVGRTPSAS